MLVDCRVSNTKFSVFQRIVCIVVWFTNAGLNRNIEIKIKTMRTHRNSNTEKYKTRKFAASAVVDT